MSKGIFVTGTGTDLGKTYVTALIVKKLRDAGRNAGYYKAAVSGNEYDAKGHLIPGDASYVNEVAGIGGNPDEMVPYVYERALSPHLASRIEGHPVEMSVVERGYHAACENYAYVTMEGSGGICCPIRYDEQEIWLEDIVKKLGLTSVIVADAGLGTINNVLLTVHYMRSQNLPIAGIILNHFHPGDVMEEDNKRMIEAKSGLPVLACVKDGDTQLDMDVEVLEEIYKEVS